MPTIFNFDREAPSPVDDLLARTHALVEESLERVLPTRDTPPARLHRAMHDAVFRGGRRARPILCRLAADYHGGADPELVGRLAAAVELVHCASLVQDDLPCFDGAGARGGPPACHVVYGEATAILVGDALLTLAFETLAGAPPRHASIAFRLLGLVTSAAGCAGGVIGGQALALEPQPLAPAIHHRHKTAALFRAAAAGGAILGGAERDLPQWARVGELIGCVESGVEGCRAELVAAVRELVIRPSLESEALHRLIEEVTRPPLR